MNPTQLKLNVHIHKIKLQARFPCSLIAYLKVQNQEVPFGTSIPIQRGEALLETSASQTFTIFFDSLKSVFSEKNISIHIFLTTNTGKFSAGSTNIQLNHLRRQVQVMQLPIEKCPDKNAYIQASINYQILGEGQRVQENQNRNTVTELFTLREKILKSQGSLDEDNYNNSNQPNSSKRQSSKMSPSQQLKSSKTKGQAGQQIQQFKNEFMQSLLRSNRKVTLKSDRQYYNNNNRFIDQSKFKSIDAEKELKNLQKKYELSVMELKNSNARIDMLEKSLKQAQIQSKNHRQKYEDLNQSNTHILKRNQFKENTYKEQIKALTDKLSLSENERQAMIFQKNTLITDFEQRQKALRLTLREKERLLNDQKNKLIKKNDQITKQMNAYISRFSESDQKIESLLNQLSSETKKYQILDQAYSKSKNEIEQYKQSLMLQRRKYDELQLTLSQYQEIQQEKKKLRKKISEQEQQNIKLSNIIANLQSNCQKFIKKTEQQQNSLKQKVIAMKNQQKDYQNIVKSHEIIKKSAQEKQRKIAQLTQLKRKQSTQVENLINQIKQLEKKQLQQIKQLRNQLKAKDSLIENLQMEINQSNQGARVCDQKIYNLNDQIEELNNKLVKIDQQSDQLKLDKATLEAKIADLHDQIQNEKHEKENLQASLRKQLKNKDSDMKKIEQNLKKFQNNSMSQQQELSFRITTLQKQIKNQQKEINEKASENQKLNELIKQFEKEKAQEQASNQQLSYSLKLKVSQITFLKETIQRNNDDIQQLTGKNNDFSIIVQRLNEKIAKYEAQVQNLNSMIKEAHNKKSGVHEQFDQYVKINKENINAFLTILINGSSTQFAPKHQDAQLQASMISALNKINQNYKSNDDKILKLKSQLDLLKNSYDQKSKNQLEIKNNLENILNKSREDYKQSENCIKQLKMSHQVLQNKIISLQNEITMLSDKNNVLQNELTNLTSNFENQSSENSTLKMKIEDLQENIKNQQQQYSMTNSRQSNKFQQEIFNLKLNITELQQKIKRQSNTNIQLNGKLAEAKNENKEADRRANAEIKRLTTQIQKLNSQIQKQARQIEHRVNQNTRFSEIEATLKGKLEQASKDIDALKQLNQNIRKRNENASQKEKELESTIYSLKNGQSQLNMKQSDLQKALKQKTNELINSKEQTFKLQQEKEKLTQQLDVANALINVKEDVIKDMENTSKNLNQQIDFLNQSIKSIENESLLQQKRYQTQISQLISSRDKYNKQLQVTKLKLQALKIQLINLQKNSEQTSKQLIDELNEQKIKNQQLQEKLTSVNKSISEQERTRAVEDQYLKPIREHMKMLRGHLAEYSRTGDQFESNKNKLLKAASIKVDFLNEKFINERMKEFSLAYNKLKVLILSCQYEEDLKEKIGTEIKKVQVILDRILRGEK